MGDKAFSFLKNGSYIDVGAPDNLAFTTALGIALWINAPIGADGAYLEQTVTKAKEAANGGNNNGATSYALSITPNGGLRADLDGNVLEVVQTAGGLISSNTWHHIALSFQAATAAGPGEIKLYVDGNPVAIWMIRLDDGNVTFPNPPLSAISTLFPTGSPVYIGRGVGHPQEDFDGYMDEIQMYNVPLTESEILQMADPTPADTTPPVVTVPGAINVTATNSAGAVVHFTATATDDVDGAITPVCSPASGSVFPVGVTTVTCTATDQAGNVGSASFNGVHVEEPPPAEDPPPADITPPVVTVPGAINVTATSSAGAVVHFTATATDDVDGAITPVCVPGFRVCVPGGRHHCYLYRHRPGRERGLSILQWGARRGATS